MADFKYVLLCSVYFKAQAVNVTTKKKFSVYNLCNKGTSKNISKNIVQSFMVPSIAPFELKCLTQCEETLAHFQLYKGI